MPTTTLSAPESETAAVAAPTVRAWPAAAAVPAHLAVSLNDAGQAGLEKLDEARTALRALCERCAARGVELLTLALPAASSAGRTLFERALAASNANEFGALRVNVLAQSDGRAELVAAARSIAAQARSGQLNAEELTARTVAQALHAQALPPVDFMLSIGAGERLTGVLLWHCAYAEFLFQPQPWWRSTSADIDAAFADYAQRCRKFGGLA
jgi:undecaprenyl pyrophosphate synthase